MKKWLITATVLLLLGIGVIIGVTVAVDMDYTKLSTAEYEKNTVEVTDEFSDISIESDWADIVLVPSEDENCRVVFRQRSDLDYTASVSDNTLVVKEYDKRQWYDRIDYSFSSDIADITVYLPVKQYGKFNATIVSGNVSVPADFSFNGIAIKGTSGEIECKASAAESLQIETDSGCINASGLTSKMLSLSTFSGDIKIADVNCTGCSAKTDSGNMKMNSLNCNNVIAGSFSGDITLKNVIVKGNITAESSSGNVRFDKSDAGEISVKTDSGDISGTLLSEKIFMIQTFSDDVNVPKTTSGGKCEITTLSGDIDIKLA